MNLALDITIVTDREQYVRRRHFRLAMQLSTLGTQLLVAVHALDGRRMLPQVLDAAALIFGPDDTDRSANLAPSSARLGGNRGPSTPDDVGKVGDEEVVGQSPDSAGWKRRAGAAAWTGQVAVVRQQEPVRPLLLVHLVVRFEAVGAERVLADENLGIAVGARTQPTLEELVVQFLDEVGRNIFAVSPVVQRRHRNQFVCANLFFCDSTLAATDAYMFQPLGSTTTPAAATAQCLLAASDVMANWRDCWRVF